MDREYLENVVQEVINKVRASTTLDDIALTWWERLHLEIGSWLTYLRDGSIAAALLVVVSKVLGFL